MSNARAVLLGWGNSTEAQLLAYERLYGMLGLPATSAIPDTRAGLIRPDGFSRSLEPLARDLAAEGGARELLVHLFSDNGFVGWAALLDILSQTSGGRRAIEAVRGVVSDSSPGLWNVRGPRDFARRFALGMTPLVARRLDRDPTKPIPIVTPMLSVAFLGYQVVFRGSVKRMLGAAARVAALQPRCPHLYLYGEDDALVPPGDVRAWIAAQKGRGIDVEAHAFPGAKHVALFPCDPRRYRERIGAFVARVVRGSGPERTEAPA
jgi:pimeloyl-ACP methyl ester carboxylesterase